jgi:hypothetical protein
MAKKIFKANLTESHPYVGYTLFSRSSANPFLDVSTGSVREFLQRSDPNGGTNVSGKGNYLVNLNYLYDNKLSSVPAANALIIRNVNAKPARDSLACAALGKNIGASTSNGFNYYLEVDTDKIMMPLVNEVVLPFSSNSESSPLYLHYTSFGFCKSNTPYIGAAAWLDSANTFTTSGVDDTVGYRCSEPSTNIPLCEYPGSGLWSHDYAGYAFQHVFIDYLKDEGYPSLSYYMAEGYNLNLNEQRYNSTYEDAVSYFGERLSLFLNEFTRNYGSSNLDSENEAYRFREDVETALQNVFYSSNNTFLINAGEGYYGVITASINTWGNYGTDDGWNSGGGGGRGSYDFKLRFHYREPSDYQGGMKEYNQHLYVSVYAYDADVTVNTYGNHRTVKSYIENYDEKLYTGAFSEIGSGSSYSSITASLVDDWDDNFHIVKRLPAPYFASPSKLYDSPYGRHWAETIYDKLEVGQFSRFDAATLEAGRVVLNKKAYLTGSGTSADTGETTMYSSTIPYCSSTNKTFHMLDALPYRAPTSGTDAGGTAYGYISSATATKTGSVYVSELRLKVKGDTRSFTNKIYIKNDKGTTTIPLNVGGTYDTAGGYTVYTITWGAATSPSYISRNSSGSNSSNSMHARICGMQQMIRNCANLGLTTGRYHANYGNMISTKALSFDAQWTGIKITGTLQLSVSGSNSYSADDGVNNTDIVIVGAEVCIDDISTIGITVNKNILKKCLITTYTSKTNYDLSLSSGRYVLHPSPTSSSWTLVSPLLYGMSGKEGKSSNMGTYYNDASIFDLGWSSTTFPVLEGSTVPYRSRITCGSYQNSFASTQFTGLTFANSKMFNGSINANTSSTDPIVGSAGSEGVSTYAMYALTSGSDGGTISSEFSGQNVITHKLPTPGLLSNLIYDSVEFNGISAWTFTRSMPLEPASYTNPHILLYRIETWIEEELTDESGNPYVRVDEDTTLTMKFNASATEFYSGKDLANMDFARAGVKNNIYLKYSDGVSSDFNAVATSLPIEIFGANSGSVEHYYGGEPLHSTTLLIEDPSTYWPPNPSDATKPAGNRDANERKLIDDLAKDIKEKIAENNGYYNIVVGGCSGSPYKEHLVNGHKIIYIGVGFYNPEPEFMPINVVFKVSYDVVSDGGTKQTYDLPHALSHFFPKDSMLHMSGKDSKSKMNDEMENKISFITNVGALNSEDGLKIITCSSTGETVNKASDPQQYEVMNIGHGTSRTFNPSSTMEFNSVYGEINAQSYSADGMYAIFNKYTGTVEYVACDNTQYANSEKITTPASIATFFDNVQGKCLKKYQHICLLPNHEKGVPRII